MKQKLRSETAPSSRVQEASSLAQETQSRVQEASNSAQETQSRGQEASSLVQEVQKGRSMVEMLGVLAIIGVLSIGGIIGYTQAMNRHKVNEILDTATKLCIIAKTKNAQTNLNHTHAVPIGEAASFADVNLSGPVAGCATDIKVKPYFSYTEDCAVHVFGCAEETNIQKVLIAILGENLSLTDAKRVEIDETGIGFCLQNRRHDRCNALTIE